MTSAEWTEGVAADGSDSRDDEELAIRLAAIELRLRLLEVPVEGTWAPDDVNDGALPATASDDHQASWRVASGGVQESQTRGDQGDHATHVQGTQTFKTGLTMPESSSVDQNDERLVWANEALQALTEMVESLRARAFQSDRQLTSVVAAAEAERERLVAALTVEQAMTRRLKDTLERAYAEGQSALGQLELVRHGRSYRLAQLLSAPTQRSRRTLAEADSSSVVPGVQPADVAVVAASGTFDRDWYLATYPDVAASGVDPFAHFMTRGGIESRCPGPLFDIGWYSDTYADEIPEGQNPLVHYLRTGWRSGNRPSEGFDPQSFASNHPVCAYLDVSPLVVLAANGREVGNSDTVQATTTRAGA